MSVFDTIRSILGLDRSSDGERTELPVESEPSDNRDIDRSVTAGTDATESTDSVTETPDSDPETAAEPAEAEAGVTEHSGTETSAAERAEAPIPDETEPEPSEDAGGESSEIGEPETEAADEPESNAETADESGDADGESVETISGIGPAYAERLANAGVETIGELRAADVSELAEQTELSEKRIAGWQDRA